MLRNSNWPRLLAPLTLSLVPLLAASCDPPEEESAGGGEQTSFRLCPQTCTGGGGSSNTNFIGNFSLANMDITGEWTGFDDLMITTKGEDTPSMGYIRVASVKCPTGQGFFYNMESWYATAAGELRFKFFGSNSYVTGTNVLGCVFHLELSSQRPSNQYGSWFRDVTISQATSVTRTDASTGYEYVFTYDFNDGNNKAQFQPGKYVTCADTGEGLGYKLVARPFLYLDAENNTYYSDANSVNFACASGADGHMIFQRNVPVASMANLDRAKADLALWTHQFNGSARTIAGNLIDVRDYTGSINYAVSPAWGLEARWGANGPVCIGGNNSYSVANRDLYDRNYYTRNLGWLDFFSAGHTLPYCGDVPSTPWIFETRARCKKGPSSAICL